jgi:hypothetical protein
MKVIDWILRKKGKQRTDAENAFIHGVLAGDVSKAPDEQQLQRELGINLPLIEDDRVSGLLHGLASQLVTDGAGNKDVQFDLDMVALAVQTSHLIRTSFLGPLDAEIGMLRARRLLRKIKMKMSHEVFEAGGGNVVDSCQQIIDSSYCDAVGGQKAMLLKVYERKYEIRTPGEKK